MDERLVEMVKGALVIAGELAYVEGAYGASAVIEQFDSFFRYMTRAEGPVSMSDEIKALQNYAFVQHTRHRIEIEAVNGLDDIFVNRKEIIRFVDACCSQEWENYNANAQFKVSFMELEHEVWVTVDIQNIEKGKAERRKKKIEQID